jgi:hypothetical protein
MFLRIILFTIVLLQPTVSNTSWSSVFNKAMTGVHWTLLTAPALMWAGNQIASSDALKQFPDASPELSLFVKSELKKHNCSEELINNLNIKIGDTFRAGYILDGKHIITLPAGLQNMQTWSDDQKMAISGAMRHEAAHLEHKDMWRMTAFSLLAPFISHYVVKGALYPITSILKPYTPLAIQGIAKIPTAFLKLGVMVPLIIAFAKYNEYSADMTAAKNIKDLEILKLTSKIHLMIYENYEREHNLNPQDRGTWRRFMYDECHISDFMHPNDLLRSKIFENAAKELEKQNSTAS